MSDSGWFAVGALLLLLALAAGWRRWWQPSSRSPHRNLATAVVILASIGALVGAPFWWFDLPASFAWDLTPVASRLLAAAAFAFAVTGILALERPGIAGIELVATLTAVYLTPLVAAVLVLHLDRFDPAAPITWGFFAAAVGLAGAALLALRGRAGPGKGEDVDPQVSAAMLLAGLVFGIWGMAMFAYPAAPLPAVFPWARDPLTARLIAVMLLSLATALLLGRKQRPQAEIALAFCASYGLGVICGWAVTRLGGATFPPLYAAALAGLGVLSAALWRKLRQIPEIAASR